MYTEAQIVEQLKENLHTSISILDALYSCQKKMYASVVERNWDTVQIETDNMNQYTHEFSENEKIRETFISSYLKSETKFYIGKSSFYTLTNTFSKQAREELNTLYREIKRLLILSKSENDILNAYIISAKTIVSGVLEEIVPARKNKIYTKNGALAEVPSESLVLNHSF